MHFGQDPANPAALRGAVLDLVLFDALAQALLSSSAGARRGLGFVVRRKGTRTQNYGLRRTIAFQAGRYAAGADGSAGARWLSATALDPHADQGRFSA